MASFAFGARHAVVDTNVRRLLARVAAGVADQPPSAASRRLAESYVPQDPDAPRWAVASMELGALVCTARSPRCGDCPISDLCAWRAAGLSPLPHSVRRPQAWHGTDRQCRGALLSTVRNASAPVLRQTLLSTWPNPEQAQRCLLALLEDGLLHGDEAFSLYE